MAKYAGVDLSFWQAKGTIDYVKLKAGKINGSVVKFAMLRTSYGCSKDTMLDAHYKGCKAAGIYVGMYHWLRAQTVSQAKSEAEWLVKLLNNYKIDYPVALDFEDEKLLELKLSPTQYGAIIDAFMTVLINANYYVALYTNPNCIRYVLNAATVDKYDLWLANWTHGKTPYDFGQKMWQYAAYGTAAEVAAKRATDVGSVDGARGPIDVDWSYIGYARKIREAGKNKPVVKYKVTGTKIVTADNLSESEGQLKSLGFSVSTTVE